MPLLKVRKKSEEIENEINFLKNKKIFHNLQKIKTGGSTFKNPKEQSSEKVWSLIKKSVPLDTSFGEASISKKHCNFLVNTGNASFEDMLKLINFYKKKCKIKNRN